MPVHEVSVPLAASSYIVRVGPGLLVEAGKTLSALRAGPQVAVIADAALRPLLPALRASVEQSGRQCFVAEVPGGEGSKTLAQTASLLSFLAEKGLSRKDTVLALGGGVVGDLAGFVAAAYLRGISWIGLPTTLLAMVDSSLGGKTGVNLPEGKNLVGAFHQPRAVLADTDTLRTLPPRERAAGMAEVIKYGLIADPDLFDRLRQGPPPEAHLPELVARCAAIKARIVAEDERETGEARALLNFGHTLGHAVENAAGYGTLLHGEAVAIGMRAAAHLSARMHDLSPTAVAEIEAVLKAHGLPTHHAGLDREKILAALARDKKGAARWILLSAIGRAEIVDGVPQEEIDHLLTLISRPA